MGLRGWVILPFLDALWPKFGFNESFIPKVKGDLLAWFLLLRSMNLLRSFSCGSFSGDTEFSEIDLFKSKIND